ncbi:hypothetical protein GQ600_1221 [Phytophthora cactorum]|nr:hypothetical protein GQ600_1221 [Phytophthora cactorum]
MLRGVNRADDETDDEVLAELMREGENRLASEQRARQGGTLETPRWRTFMVAVMFQPSVRGAGPARLAVSTAQRAALHCVRGPLAGAVHPRVRCTPGKRWHAASAACAWAGLCAAYIVLTIGRNAFPSGTRGKSEVRRL